VIPNATTPGLHGTGRRAEAFCSGFDSSEISYFLAKSQRFPRTFTAADRAPHPSTQARRR